MDKNLDLNKIDSLLSVHNRAVKILALIKKGIETAQIMKKTGAERQLVFYYKNKVTNK